MDTIKNLKSNVASRKAIQKRKKENLTPNEKILDTQKTRVKLNGID